MPQGTASVNGERGWKSPSDPRTIPSIGGLSSSRGPILTRNWGAVMAITVHRTFGLGLLLVPSLLILGCRGSSSITEQMDSASTARLNELGEDAMVVLSCRVTEVPESPPDMGKGAKELARTDHAVLLQIPKSELNQVGKLSGLESVTVWGEEGVLQKLDPRLKRQLLAAIGGSETGDLALMVRMHEEVTDIKEKLAACGCQARTVAGRVITVDAPPSAVLCALQIPELAAISAPRPVTPHGG